MLYKYGALLVTKPFFFYIKFVSVILSTNQTPDTKSEITSLKKRITNQKSLVKSTTETQPTTTRLSVSDFFKDNENENTTQKTKQNFPFLQELLELLFRHETETN